MNSHFTKEVVVDSNPRSSCFSASAVALLGVSSDFEEDCSVGLIVSPAALVGGIEGGNTSAAVLLSLRFVEPVTELVFMLIRFISVSDKATVTGVVKVVMSELVINPVSVA